MKIQTAIPQNLLSAVNAGRRVTIGVEAEEELKRLSDSRAIFCPFCNSLVTLHAGRVRAHHFAHLPGAICRVPNPEPETEEHLNGKLFLAEYIRAKVPNGRVTVEAWFPETKQRADILLETDEPGRERTVIEFQCANLRADEWRRRRNLYREAGVKDLWFLGGSRFRSESIRDSVSNGFSYHKAYIRTLELERTLILAGEALLFLFLSNSPQRLPIISRVSPFDQSDLTRIVARVTTRRIMELDFPWNLVEREIEATGDMPALKPIPVATQIERLVSPTSVLEWLKVQHRTSEEMIPDCFGIVVKGMEAFSCPPKLWQAGLYFRFIQGHIGERWLLSEAESWARAHLPLTQPANLKKLKTALQQTQEIFCAAGFLTLPKGGARTFGTVRADIHTLGYVPERAEVEKLVRYRRTLTRD